MRIQRTFQIPFIWSYMALAAYAGAPLADDVEIYSGSSNVSGTVPPNVLLLLDTSQSMVQNDVITSVTTVVKPAVPYDPAVRYTIPYNTDKEGNMTTCPDMYIYNSSSLDTDDPLDSAGCNDNGSRFMLNLFQCQAAANDLNTQGHWTGALTQFRPSPDNDWVSFSNNRSLLAGSYKECREDDGIHGRASFAPGFTGTDNLQLSVPYSSTKTRVSMSSNAAFPAEWVELGDPNEPNATFLASSNEWTPVTLYHPNYMRYLYGWVDVDNDGVYDSGEGYNEELTSTTTTNHGTRLAVLKRVMLELLDSWTGVNVGIMRYNVQSGSRTLYPMSKIEDHRDQLKAVISSLAATDGTPQSEALYEAFNYYRGHYVEFGEAHSTDSVAETRDPGDSTRYRTPIGFSCQANTIIHMTDGKPTRDGGTESSGSPVLHYVDGSGNELTTNDVDVAIHALPGFASLPSGDTSCDFNSTSGEQDGLNPDNCMDELAEYMATRRHDVDILNDDGSLLASVSAEPIKTFTIGFALRLPFVETTAAKGQGAYYTAFSVDELKTAFNDMIEDIKNTGTKVISPPGVAVEAFSRSMHLNTLFFNLFQPEEKPLYKGNLKRYELAVNADGDVIVIDANRDPAINPENGGFLDDSRSWWSASPDGNVVADGGMASRFPATRNVYTFLGAQDLTAQTNAFNTANPNIGSGPGELDLPAADVGERDNIINWARGQDVYDEDGDNDTSERRSTLGDPLHSRPTLVVYDSDSNNDAVHDDPDMQVIILTNDGFMRAVDADTGVEAWSFIPKETWHVLNKARRNDQATKLYGLDGQITAWTVDVNGDGVIDPADGDSNHVYFGMRRGGRNYYALDLTVKNSPKHLWQINGGSGDFATLGQTWGQMQRATIDINNTPTRVLVFTGGYDTAYDSAVASMPTAIAGNDIFIIRENDGSLVWRANRAESDDDLDRSDLKFAFPAEPSVLDMNHDGLHDRIYAVDIGGQVWRFDIQNGSAADELVTGDVIAKLSTPGGENNRKFFNKPDVAILQSGSHQNVSINIGSGFRASPLNLSTQDYFFSIRDPYTYGSNSVLTHISDVADYTAATITAADLTDVTSFTGPPVVTQGWKLGLKASGDWTGEKALASSVTVNGEVLFTTHEPPHTASADGCVVSVGTARRYTVALKNGLPTLDSDGDHDIDEDDARSEEVLYAGIPPEVIVLFPEATNGTPVGCTGPDCKKLNFNNSMRRTYWYTPGRDPAN